MKAEGDDDPRDAIGRDWMVRLAEWGMTPVLIPNMEDAAVALLDDLGADILVLTGGDDLGATPERDATEAHLLDHALAAGLPVLGVCRGLQLINSHLGGRLTAVEGHVGEAHPVTIAPAWQSLYGATATVNSYHSQGVAADGVADGLTVTATDAGGNVEALCHFEKPLAAVMWHPERGGVLDGDRVLLAGLAGGGLPWRQGR